MDQWLISICFIHLECDAWLHAVQSHRNGFDFNRILVWCTSKHLKCFFFRFFFREFQRRYFNHFLLFRCFLHTEANQMHTICSAHHIVHIVRRFIGLIAVICLIVFHWKFSKCSENASHRNRSICSWMLLANVLPKQFFVVQFINEKLTQIMDGITYFVDVGRFVPKWGT